MELDKIHSLFLKCSGACTDTRKVTDKSMFFALKGDNFNGNKYALQAIESGCKYAVVDEAEFALDDRFILVDNVLKTLQDLAHFHRMKFDIPLLGITGSNGKTTTKELIGAILDTSYKTLITQGNLNNHIGVPLTLLQLTKEHEIAVIEMGANKPGDIKELAEIAAPNHGLITNVGMAHIEGFESLEGVIKTKKELYDYILSVNGKIFINHEDELLNNIVPAPLLHITYGQEEEGYINGALAHLTPFIQFSWRTERYFSPIIETNLVGKYNFTNFLAAIAVGHYFEVDPHQINDALKDYKPTNNRSQVLKTNTNTIIVDCYNANPSSMLSALESFIEIENGRKISILGDMLELGNISKEEHQKTVDFLKENNMIAYLVGEEFGKTDTEFLKFENVDSLSDYLNADPLKYHMILLKGSRGIKLEKLIEAELI